MKKRRVKLPTVYHLPAANPKEDYAESLVNVLTYRAYRLFGVFLESQLVAIKASCGESKEENARLAKYVEAAGRELKCKRVSVFMCDTTNRHKDISSNALKQIEEARCQCFEELRSLLSFFMLDGINGSYEHPIKPKALGGKKEVYLGGELPNLDGIFALTAPFAHGLCGVAGSLHNLGAGLASKRGKIKMHTLGKPRVKVERCFACKRCLKECPTKAIYMDGAHVAIEEDKCVDCGRCVEIARRCGISYAWNATSEHYMETMLEHAVGAIEMLKGKIIFANVVFDPNGCLKRIFVSRDPVAVDAATLENAKTDAAFPKENLDAFKRQIDAAAKLGVGSKEREIVEVAY